MDEMLGLNDAVECDNWRYYLSWIVVVADVGVVHCGGSFGAMRKVVKNPVTK